MEEKIQEIQEKKKDPGGRPKATIDWDYVDSLLEAGCSGMEIAANIGIAKETMYDRCVTDKGMMFSIYSQKLNAKGESLLRKAQYDKARGVTDKGDNTLLIWLGKTRLKQIDASQLAAAEASKINYNIVTDAKGLASGIPAEKLSNSDNNSAESGDEKSGMGSTS